MSHILTKRYIAQLTRDSKRALALRAQGLNTAQVSAVIALENQTRAIARENARYGISIPVA